MTSKINDLATAYVLSFLTTHEIHELENEDSDKVDSHPNGTITLDPSTQSFSIQLKGRRNDSKWTFTIPGTVFEPLKNAPGTLFLAKDAPIPTGANTFFAQQYRGQSGEAGRTVVEFFTDNEITAVFKTSDDNFGASGTGVWTGA